MKINDELFDYFKQAGTIKHYQKNDIIYMQDDHADELCLVLKGRVRVYHITKNGDEINYDVLDKGRIFGESSLYENAYRPTTVSAINDVEIITCHLNDLYPYLSSSLDLTITLLKMFNDNCNHLTQLLKWAQTYDRFEKVAAFLYELSATNNIEKNIGQEGEKYTLDTVQDGNDSKHYEVKFLPTQNEYVILEDGTVLSKDDFHSLIEYISNYYDLNKNQTIHINKENTLKIEYYKIRIYHNNNNVVSSLINKCVAFDNSKVTFDIDSILDKGNIDCDMDQDTKIINMGAVDADIRPNMYIEEDDVVARHGSVIGKFSPDDIFYITSRRIPEKEAILLLIRGFILSNLIVDDSLSEKIIKIINNNYID